MSGLEAKIQTQVDNLLSVVQFGEAVKVYKFQSAADNYPYGRGGAIVYSTALDVTGRIITEPTEELLTLIGDGLKWDVALLFSRLELVRKFSAADENEWLSVDDEFEHGGMRYACIKMFPTGRVHTQHSLIVVVCKSKEGAGVK